MNQITAYTGTQIKPVQEFSESLIDDFIRYIDRTPATARTYCINLRQFFRWMKEAGVKQPVRDDILSYRQYLSDKGLTANTITSYLGAVRVFFSWTGVKGIYPNIFQNIHAPKVDRSKPKKDALEVQEVLDIEKSIEDCTANKIVAAGSASKDTAGRIQRATEQGKRLYAMYELAVNAGLRTIEISRANVKDLETKGNQNFIYLWRKGRSEADKRKPIAPEVAVAIQDYLEARTDNFTGDSPLFVSTGNRSGGQRIASTTIGQMLKKAMVEAGYNSPRLTAHSLRHTAITCCMEMTDNNIHDAQIFADHASPATTQNYLHIQEDKRQADISNQLYIFMHSTSTVAASY